MRFIENLEDIQEFSDWIMLGVGKGWVSLPTCDTHEGLPLMPEEEFEFEDGLDPCIVGMRVWTENILQ